MGFAAAVELTTDWDKVATLRDGLEGAVRAWRPDVVIAGGEVPRLPNISCLITPRLSGELQVMALDLAGVAVGVGAACSSGRIGPSHVLAAMGLPAGPCRERRAGEPRVEHWIGRHGSIRGSVVCPGDDPRLTRG